MTFNILGTQSLLGVPKKKVSFAFGSVAFGYVVAIKLSGCITEKLLHCNVSTPNTWPIHRGRRIGLHAVLTSLLWILTCEDVTSRDIIFKK